MVKINTQNILFICGGAFDGIQRHISARMRKQSIGFKTTSKQDTHDKENLLQYISPSDLKAFGLIPELIGRVPVLSYLNPLDRETLQNILTEPKNALVKQYKKLFDLEGVALHFDQDALDFIVDKAMEYKLGARGLRSIMEAIMTDLMFELPSQKDIKTYALTRAYCEEKMLKSKHHRFKAA
jgi:ATP-dependent Clp protease ATP-binding subunit ClpX